MADQLCSFLSEFLLDIRVLKRHKCLLGTTVSPASNSIVVFTNIICLFTFLTCNKKNDTNIFSIACLSPMITSVKSFINFYYKTSQSYTKIIKSPTRFSRTYCLVSIIFNILAQIFHPFIWLAELSYIYSFRNYFIEKLLCQALFKY